MIRFTTPMQTFRMKINPNTFTEIIATYEQNGKEIIEKKKSNGDFTFTTETEGDETIYLAAFRFTQLETGMFDESSPVSVQLTAVKVDNQRVASRIFNFSVHKMLHDEEVFGGL